MLDAIRALLGALFAALARPGELVLENIVLRQQVAVLLRRTPHPRLRPGDRRFWLLLRLLWSRWAEVLVLVRPETVVRWHRAGFRWWWRWKSAPGVGRPPEEARLCALIVKLAIDNPTWGAPRIHGELLKLGFAVAQSTVSKYLPRKRRPPDEAVRQDHPEGQTQHEQETQKPRHADVLLSLRVSPRRRLQGSKAMGPEKTLRGEEASPLRRDDPIRGGHTTVTWG